MDDNVFVISHPSYLPPPFSTLWLSLHFPPASSLQRSAFSLHPFSPFVSSPFGLLLSLSIFLTGCTNSWWESSKWNSAVASFNSTALVILNFTACQDKTALSGSVFFFLSPPQPWYFVVLFRYVIPSESYWVWKDTVFEISQIFSNHVFHLLFL